MKESINTDIFYIKLILKYVQELHIIYRKNGIENHVELKGTLETKYSVTQIMTNIYESSRNLGETAYDSLPSLKSINLKGIRTAASHFHHDINYFTVYNLWLKLLSKTIYNEVRNYLAGGNEENEDQTDD